MITLGFKEWVEAKGKERNKKKKDTIPEIPKEFLWEVEELSKDDYFNYYCSKCGFQTNDFDKTCPKCKGNMIKTKKK